MLGTLTRRVEVGGECQWMIEEVFRVPAGVKAGATHEAAHVRFCSEWESSLWNG